MIDRDKTISARCDPRNARFGHHFGLNKCLPPLLSRKCIRFAAQVSARIMTAKTKNTLTAGIVTFKTSAEAKVQRLYICSW